MLKTTGEPIPAPPQPEPLLILKITYAPADAIVWLMDRLPWGWSYRILNAIWRPLDGIGERLMFRYQPEIYRCGRACPCTFTPGSNHMYMEDADPDCEICWGWGQIVTDIDGNVIGNEFAEHFSG